ncbi:MAG: pyruvoyl-dependent arginine decarboxylase [Chloroflexota bacterium]
MAGLELNTWSAPNVFWLASGSAEGATPINAFDNALLNAGVGNLNLVKVSSVVPTGAVMLDQPIPIGPGTLVPAVYATRHSNVPGDRLASVIGIGLSEDSHGMIFEHSSDSAEHAEQAVRQMVEDAFAQRGMKLARLMVRMAEHRVEKLGCTVSAVVLWWR